MGMPKEYNNVIHIIYVAQATTWTFTALSTIVFGISLFCRYILLDPVRSWEDIRPEDIILALSWVFDITRQEFYQMGMSEARTVTPDSMDVTLPDAEFWINLANRWTLFSVTLPKVAISLLIIRIFRPRKWMKVTIMVSCLGLCASCLVAFILLFVQCIPSAASWDPFKYPNAHCWPPNIAIIYTIVASGYSALMDFALAIYPGFIISRLQMSKWQRFTTIMLLGIGIAAGVVAVCKTVAMKNLLGHPAKYDRIYHTINVCMWNSLENDFVLIAASLPSTPPFFRMCKKLSSRYSTRASTFNWSNVPSTSRSVETVSRNPVRKAYTSLNASVRKFRSSDLADPAKLDETSDMIPRYSYQR